MCAMPTPDELANLRSEALVPLICRCARRLEPIISAYSPGDSANELTRAQAATVFRETLERAERYSSVQSHEDPLIHGKITGNAQVWAFQAASIALRAVRAISTKDPAAFDLAAASLRCASGAAAHWVSGSEDKLIGAVKRDFDVLSVLGANEGCEGDTQVSAELLGSIWPDGEPVRWSAGGDAVVREKLLVRPHYHSRHLNESINLYQGRLEFSTSRGVWRGEGAIDFLWLPQPEIVFRINGVTPAHVVPYLGPGELTSPTFGLKSQASLTTLNHSSNQDETSLAFEGHLPEFSMVGTGESISAVVFHLANFHDYLARRQTPSPPEYDVHRTVFEGEGWRVTLQGDKDLKKLVDSLRDSGGCAFTHAGRFERVDGGTFDLVAAVDVLDALFYFFSFARGQWSPALLPVGVDPKGATVWQRGDARTISHWRFRYSWFPPMSPESLAGVFPGFMGRWIDPDWNRTLRVAIHWNIVSNEQAGAIEGALVLQQLAIELLASKLFVEDLGSYTERQFKDPKAFPAFKKMELLLAEAGIPDVIPPRLANLSAHAVAENWPNGPQALTRLRNYITHPSGTNRLAFDRVSLPTRFEAFNLALWYLELILLWVMRYDGQYVNRLTVQFNGDQEFVPWAAPGP